MSEVLTPQQQKALVAWYKWFSFQAIQASQEDNDLFDAFKDDRYKLLQPLESDSFLKLTEIRKLAIDLWCLDYSARLDRIIRDAFRRSKLGCTGDKSTEDYTGYEQDLFESFGCSTEPFEI